MQSMSRELTHMRMITAPSGALQILILYQGLRCFHSTSRGRNPWTRLSALRCTESSPIADLGLDWGIPVGAIVAVCMLPVAQVGLCYTGFSRALCTIGHSKFCTS